MSIENNNPINCEALDTQESSITDEMLERLHQKLPTNRILMDDDCPHAEHTMACALGELNPGEETKTRHHMHMCDFCFDLYFDMRTAQFVSSTSEKQEIVAPEILAAIQIGKKKIPPVVKSEIQIGFFDSIMNFFSNMMMPQIIAASSAIVLVVFVFGLHQFTNAPIIARFYLTADPPSATRGEVQESHKKPHALRAEDVLRTGDSYKINLEIKKDAHVYVILSCRLNNKPERMKMLFSGKLKAGKTVLPLDNDYGFRLDYYTGTETVFLVVSRGEIDQFDKKARQIHQAGKEKIQEVFPDHVSVTFFDFKHQ